jgi:cathepsin B
MFKLIIVGFVAVVAQALHPIRHEIVNEINASSSTWTAHDVETNPINHWSEEDIKARLGTIIQPPVEGIPEPDVYNDILPTAFDSRTKWPDCVHPIRDQAKCGSCWAFGASETLSDRFCIASNGKTNVVLAP